jgi:3D (Asp-Asp-Asp) domain-containing protein
MRLLTSTVLAMAVLPALLAPAPTAQVGPGTEAQFTATAYCDRGLTKSGVRTREGIVAADPDELPVGSVVRIVEAGDRRYEGVYTVMDTGGKVQGRRIDVYVPDCDEAKAFGVRPIRVVVVRLGWDSQAVVRRGSTRMDP